MIGQKKEISPLTAMIRIDLDMLDSTLQPTYNKLEARTRQYNKYARPSEWLVRSIRWVLSIAVLVFFAFVYLKIFDFIPYLILAVFLYYFAYKISTFFIDRKARAFRLSPNELAIFYACSIILTVDSLSDPETGKNPDLKKQYQKGMEQQARALLSILEKNWTHGDFKLASNVFGTSLSDLKQGFLEKVVPNIEHGDPKDLGKVQTIMLGLVYANSVSDLEHVNESISKLEPRQVSKKGFVARTSNFLKNTQIVRYLNQHQIAQYSLVVVGIFFACCVVYFVGVNLLLISKDNSFIASVGLFGVLFVGYVNYVKKEKEKVK